MSSARKERDVGVLCSASRSLVTFRSIAMGQRVCANRPKHVKGKVEFRSCTGTCLTRVVNVRSKLSTAALGGSALLSVFRILVGGGFRRQVMVNICWWIRPLEEFFQFLKRADYWLRLVLDRGKCPAEETI
jgi:hypothetical protein